MGTGVGGDVEGSETNRAQGAGGSVGNYVLEETQWTLNCISTGLRYEPSRGSQALGNAGGANVQGREVRGARGAAGQVRGDGFVEADWASKGRGSQAWEVPAGSSDASVDAGAQGRGCEAGPTCEAWARDEATGNDGYSISVRGAVDSGPDVVAEDEALTRLDYCRCNNRCRLQMLLNVWYLLFSSKASPALSQSGRLGSLQ